MKTNQSTTNFDDNPEVAKQVNAFVDIKSLKEKQSMINSAKFLLRAVQRQLNSGGKLNLDTKRYESEGGIDDSFLEELRLNHLVDFEVICDNTENCFSFFPKTQYSKKAKEFRKLLDTIYNQIEELKIESNRTLTIPKRLLHETSIRLGDSHNSVFKKLH